MNENLSLIKKIGNFVSNILLGETKEIILRTDERVQLISKSLENRIEPDLKNLRERFMIVEDRVRTMWKDEVAPAHSPRQLNERGTNVLTGSGIKEIIDEKRDNLLLSVKTRNITNPYDAEQAILNIVSNLRNDAPLVEKLKLGAFSVGADIDTVLLVGGIYLRDLIFPDLGFKTTDLDKLKI